MPLRHVSCPAVDIAKRLFEIGKPIADGLSLPEKCRLNPKMRSPNKSQIFVCVNGHLWQPLKVLSDQDATLSELGLLPGAALMLKELEEAHA